MPRPDSFSTLLAQLGRLRFEPHNIRGQLDPSGHYTLPFAREFPLSIRLFRFRSGAFTSGVTWHEQFELFFPLDSIVHLNMGSSQVSLHPGDLLVVDSSKPHHVVDRPGLNSRVVVISFLPEFVYSLGSPSHDFAFLLPFYSQLENHPHILERRHPSAPEIHAALGRLVDAYFPATSLPYREAGCKSALLSLLLPLARRFRDAEVMRWEFEKQRELARRFAKLIEELRRDCTQRIPLAQASKMCGMSPAQFTRTFKRVSGMSYLGYVIHTRLSEASRLLRLRDRTIAEVADLTGFSDQSHLDRRFKRAFGMTPRAFQLQATASKSDSNIP